MNTRKLIIECGVAETRAVLIENDETRRFWFGPARGDEAADRMPVCGRRFAGKILSTDKSLNAMFVDIGAATAGFLPLAKGEAGVSDGAMIGVEVKRAPRGAKGATLSRLVGEACGQGVGPLGEAADAVLQAMSVLGGGVDEVIIDSGAASAVLRRHTTSSAQVTHESGNLFEAYGATAALDGAFARAITLPSGGRLTIDEAEALTAIDVDSASAISASSERLSARINKEAVIVAACEIKRRDIGGQIVIDFLPISNAARGQLNANLKQHFTGAQKAGWTKSGLFTFVLPRPGPSLMEWASEDVAGHGGLASGRQYSAAYLLTTVMWRAEALLKVLPAARCRIGLGRELKRALDDRADWIERLYSRYGARVNFVLDATLEGRDFELIEQ